VALQGLCSLHPRPLPALRQVGLALANTDTLLLKRNDFRREMRFAVLTRATQGDRLGTRVHGEHGMSRESVR
jgi:hypothetical protein